MKNYYTIYFGQAYGEGNYSGGTYSCTEEQQSQGICTAAATAGGGSLPNTGVAIASMVTLACLLVVVAIVVRVWRRRPVTESAVYHPNEQSDTDDQFAPSPQKTMD